MYESGRVAAREQSPPLSLAVDSRQNGDASTKAR
jgi:hypothetical protein